MPYTKNGKKIFTEKETREHLLDLGKDFGFEKDLIRIFNKFDMLLKCCTNAQEREALQFMAVEEINKIMDPVGYQGYTVNGKAVLGKDQLKNLKKDK